MDASNLAFNSFLMIVQAWVYLSLGRVATARYFRSVAASEEAYERSRRGRPGAARPPAVWDFRRHRLVPVSPGDAGAPGGTPRNGRRYPFWLVGLAIGKRLLRVPTAALHGAFAVLTLLLALLWWTLRNG